jgi:hypothetical protein
MNQNTINSSSVDHLIEEELRSDSFDMVIYRMIEGLTARLLNGI